MKRRCRVSMDVSFASGSGQTNQAVTGVGRVIKEVYQRLVTFQDLDVKAVGYFANDWNPISTSVLAQKWASEVLPICGASMPSFKSSTGIARRLANYQVSEETLTQMNPKSRGNSFRLRVIRRLLKLDARSNLSPRNTDIFFSTFRPVPSDLSKLIPRLVLIYDIYPLRFPELCDSCIVKNIEGVVKDLDPTRDVVVAISEFTKLDLCSISNFPLDRVVVSPLAAENAFQPCSSPIRLAQIRSRYHLQDAPYLLSVSNPQPRKNIVTAIRAFANALELLPHWEGNLVLAGNPDAGWGEEAIDSELKKNPKIEKRVLRIGTVENEDLPFLYNGASAFIFPSTFEGFGLPVLEAMQSGTPVICSNSTSLPEVVGDSAIICDPMDAAQFAEGIARLVKNPEERKRMSLAGQKRANCFSWECTAKCVYNAIQLLVANK